jgi:hypothetical protein
VVCLTVASLALVACGDDASVATDGQYCATINANAAQLAAPSIAAAADVDAAVALYRAIRDAAPLAVRKEWDVMVVDIETAATVVPSDPASMQRVADTARASQNAATAVADYTSKVCGVTLGAPPTPPPATTAISSP